MDAVKYNFHFTLKIQDLRLNVSLKDSFVHVLGVTTLPRQLGLQAPALFLHLTDTNAVGFSLNGKGRIHHSLLMVSYTVAMRSRLCQMPFLILVQAHHIRPSMGDQKGSWGSIGHLLITLSGS